MHLFFVLSVAAAHAATNLDNLAIMLAIAPVIGLGRAAFGFVVAQFIALGAAMTMGAVAAELAASWASWLGLVPIVLGLHALWERWRSSRSDTGGLRPSKSIVLTIFTFLGVSTDSFAVMTAIFADSVTSFDLAALAGALISIASITGAAVVLGGLAARAEAVTHRLDVVGPVAMVVAGLYILMDTPTDTS